MYKKVIAVFLCVGLFAAVFSGCIKERQDDGKTSQTTVQETTSVQTPESLSAYFPDGANPPETAQDTEDRVVLISHKNEMTQAEATAYYNALAEKLPGAAITDTDGVYRLSWSEGNADYFIQCTEDADGVTITVDYCTAGVRA